MKVVKNVVHVDKDQNLTYAINLMEKRGVSRLIVTEDSAVLGIITEGDIIRRMGSSKGRDVPATHLHVSSAMTHEIVTLPFDVTLKEAAHQMVRQNRYGFPLVAGDTITGWITKTDIAASLSGCEKTIADVYDKSPAALRFDQSLAHARAEMERTGVERFLVLDNNVLVGVLTHKDVMAGLLISKKSVDHPHHADPGNMLVGSFMTEAPMTVKPEQTVGKAVELMLKRKVSGLPVVSSPWGLLTKKNLVAAVASGKLP
ncbi:Inosine-5'-monophosphate dehydrogenase [uncultured archaeon]|nr:Inosine-5'-monophosphate dehydrogenase [uncultured archaeon]